MHNVVIGVLMTPQCDECAYHDPTTGPRPCSVDDHDFLRELFLGDQYFFCGCFVGKQGKTNKRKG